MLRVNMFICFHIHLFMFLNSQMRLSHWKSQKCKMCTEDHPEPERLEPGVVCSTEICQPFRCSLTPRTEEVNDYRCNTKSVSLATCPKHIMGTQFIDITKKGYNVVAPYKQQSHWSMMKLTVHSRDFAKGWPCRLISVCCNNRNSLQKGREHLSCSELESFRCWQNNHPFAPSGSSPHPTALRWQSRQNKVQPPCSCQYSCCWCFRAKPREVGWSLDC